MFSLQFHCSRAEVDVTCAELWDFQPIALSETEIGDSITLLAGFSTEEHRDHLLKKFSVGGATWQRDDTDWVAQTQSRWPTKQIGSRLVICAPWNAEDDARGRVKVVLNPGMASGTGEHPCTQLALEELEIHIPVSSRVADVGAGSGILALAAMQLGATTAIALEPDLESLETARENIALNLAHPLLVAGSSDVISDGWAEVTLANISGSVLLAILDDLMRITAAGGILILTGFELNEAERFQQFFPGASLRTKEGWACLTAQLS